MHSLLNGIEVDGQISTKVYSNGVMITLVGHYEEYCEWKQNIENTEYYWELIEDDKCIDGMFLQLHSATFETDIDGTLLILLEFITIEL